MEPEIISLLDSPPCSPIQTPTRPSFEPNVDSPPTPKRKRDESVADSGYGDGGSISKRRLTTPMKTPTPAPRSTRSPILKKPTLMKPFMQSTKTIAQSSNGDDSTTSNAATTPTTKTSDKHSSPPASIDQPGGNDNEPTTASTLLSISPLPSQHTDSTTINNDDVFATASTITEPIATSINAATTTTNVANATIQHRTHTTPTSRTSKPSISPIHPRYIPTYHSPHSPTKLHDPATFSFKPPFWRRWTPAEYTHFATHLQQNFDPLPIARQLGKSAHEIQHIFNAVVVAPLEDEAGKVCKVVEGRMERVFDLFAKGVQMRSWEGGNGQEVRGEFTGVRPGVVELVDEHGGFVEVAWGDLVEEDRMYVEGLVGRQEMGVLLREG